jgi:hypothetical protein
MTHHAESKPLTPEVWIYRDAINSTIARTPCQLTNCPALVHSGQLMRPSWSITSSWREMKLDRVKIHCSHLRRLRFLSRHSQHQQDQAHRKNQKGQASPEIGVHKDSDLLRPALDGS